MTDTTPKEVTVKRCYLAGPMRGYAQFNFPAFFAAAKSLRERGYEVWSPAENDVHQDGFDPAKDAAQPMRHYMKRDLPAVLDADFVAVLPNWERSQGATLEVTVAQTCGIPVLDAATLEPVAVNSFSEETKRAEEIRRDAELRLCFRADHIDMLKTALRNACESEAVHGQQPPRLWLDALQGPPNPLPEAPK